MKNEFKLIWRKLRGGYIKFRIKLSKVVWTKKIIHDIILYTTSFMIIIYILFEIMLPIPSIPKSDSNLFILTSENKLWWLHIFRLLGLPSLYVIFPRVIMIYESYTIGIYRLINKVIKQVKIYVVNSDNKKDI